MKRLILIFIVTVAVLSELNAATSTLKLPGGMRLKKYRILSVVGRVTAWEPWSTGWTTVHPKMELWESTLVQIHKGGTFSFELATKEALKGIQGEAIQVKLGTPIVVRLNEDITRQIELGSYFIPNLPKDALKPDAPQKPLYESISEAWQRFAAMATVRDLKNDSPLQSMNSSDSALALRSKHLKLLTPTNGQTVLVDKVPSEIRVMWEKVEEPNTTYEIRLWKVDQMRGGPSALTQIDYHFLKVPREGAYYIQVATSDGRYQSDPHQIFVSLPIGGRMKNKTTLVGLASMPIPLKLPPDGFVYHTKSFPVQLTYEWDLNIETDDDDPPFLFRITDMAGKKLVETKVTGRRFIGKFAKPGRYKWSVAATLPPTETDLRPREILSEPNEFEIQAVTDRDPIETLLMANKSGVLYLENGF